MASTVIRGAQIKDSTVQRHDLDTSTVGQAVVTKLVQGSGVTLSSTGADSGTGDVTVSTSAIPLASSSTSGLMNQTSGNTTDFVDATNNSQPLQPVIWSVRLRSFNVVGNPTFEVNQRLSGGAAIGNGVFALDRWSYVKAGSGAMVVYGSQASGQSVIIPGTSYQISSCVLNIQQTTQQTTLAAGDLNGFYTIIEGPMLRELINDVHSISLLAYTTVSGGLKFCVKLSDMAATRSLVKLCTIPSANTWTLITLPNIPIWASGTTWSLSPGVAGYNLGIFFAAGTTWQAPSADVWNTGNFCGFSSMDNLGSKPVNSQLLIGFIQHEPGALCTTPIDCPFTKNYDDCLRYFQKSWNLTGTVGSTGTNFAGNFVGGGTFIGGLPAFQTPMAKAPTVTIYDGNNGAANSIYDANAGTHASVSSVSVTEKAITSIGVSAAHTTANIAQFNYTADTGW